MQGASAGGLIAGADIDGFLVGVGNSRFIFPLDTVVEVIAAQVADIQTDRIAQALALARRFNALVVLKGCGSVVAAPDGAWWINTSGNPAMATAGMGDVLTGLIVALLAQGWPARTALLAGVHLHGCAADRFCAEAGVQAGLLAGDILTAARRGLNRWLGVAEHRP